MAGGGSGSGYYGFYWNKMTINRQIQFKKYKVLINNLNKINYMKHLVYILLILTVTSTGCAWIRISDKPVFEETETLPLNIGLKIDSKTENDNFKNLIATYLDDFKTFNSISYPYRTSDQVDGILEVQVNGKWSKNIIGGIFAPFIFWGVFVGPSRNGKHVTDGSFILNQKRSISFSYTTNTKIKYGLIANKDIVKLKGDSLQACKIAYQIAGRILLDREQIMNDVKAKE
jgi:hypothetical protein